MKPPVPIERDPFARQTTLRECLPPTEATCDWCGGTRKGGGLFRYSVERDAIRPRPQPLRGRFCSRACQRSYNG